MSKTRNMSKIRIGGANIILMQGVLLVCSVLWIFLFLFFLLIKPSFNGFYTLFFWVAVIGLMNKFYLKLDEVDIDGDSLHSQNLFRSKKLNRADHFFIEKTLFSPFIFKVVSSD